jgi:hypothetical protein
VAPAAPPAALAAVAQLPVVVAAAPPPAAAAASPPPALAAIGGPLRSLEDTVVELLRPMLRQWLDDNMPRIVEKALRVELAEQLKKPKSMS